MTGNFCRIVRAATAPLLALALLATGCSGGDSDDPKPDPTPDPDYGLEVPQGVTLTAGGSQVNVGSPVTIVYAPDEAESSVITATVDRVVAGERADIAKLKDAGVKADSRPFYVYLHVRNVGPGDLSGSKVPLQADDTMRDTFKPSASSEDFRACEGGPLPADFAPGDTAKRCFVFQPPDGEELETLQLRTTDLASPVFWQI